MIKLSISKKGYAILENGTVVSSKGSSANDNRISLIENLRKGLIDVRNRVSYKDTLVVETSDAYLIKWVDDYKPSEATKEVFARMFIELNNLQCLVNFVKVPSPMVDHLELQHSYIPVSDFNF